MNDFASFTPKNGNNADADAVREVLDTYGGKSEGDLLKAIYARAVEGKRNGTLTNEQIDAFYAQFSPFVDGPKRKRLKKLVEQLKEM